MSEHSVKVEVKTRIDFHGVEGVSLFGHAGYVRRDADCDCPPFALHLTARASDEGVAVQATRLMAARLHAALGDFLAPAPAEHKEDAE